VPGAHALLETLPLRARLFRRVINRQSIIR
jgi:hypothetical protein